MENEMYKLAMSYLAKGWSVLPCGLNKIPLVSWKEFQTRFPTEKEVEDWFTTFPNAQVGIITGKLSNLTVVDVEKGGDPSFLPQETMIVESGNKGYHYYYLYREGVNNKARIKDLIDIRGEGGYVVSPNSVSEKGPYTLLQDLPLLPFPKHLFPEKVDIFQYPESSSQTYEKRPLKDYPGYGKGQRNSEIARYIGYILTQLHPADWETEGWQIIERANLRNTPVLLSKELKATFKSILGTERRSNPLGRTGKANFKENTFLPEEPIMLGDETDEIKHLADVADEQKIDINDIYPLQMPCFDKAILGGVNSGDVIVISGQTAHGKRLHVDTPILTPRGWKRNGDIVVGDEIIGKNGKKTRVTGAHPINIGKSYKIVFNDGTSAIADGEHLWTVQSSKQRRFSKKWVTLTTKEILNRGLIGKNRKTAYKWFLPIADPVIFSKKTLVIKPYTLGVLLANGSLSSSVVSVTTNDEYIARKCINESKNIDISEYVCKNQTARRWSFKKFHSTLKKIGLDRFKSSEKFIPIEYLFSSIDDRISILRALMDCDGSVVKNNRAQYYSVSIKLAEGVVTLVRSLGGIAGISKENRTKGKNGYVVRLWTPMNPFSLKRKYINYTPRPWFKAIKKIKLSNECKMRCLSVGNEDGLYVIEDFIVTHNTSLCQDWTISMLRGEKNVKSLWFSYEILPNYLWKKFQEMGMNREDCVFVPAKNSSGNLAWVEAKIQEGKEKFGIKSVFIDHLGFLLPKTNGILGKNFSSNYASFITQIMRDLKTIALKEEVIVFLPVHMKKVEYGRKQADINDLKDCVVEGQKVVVNGKLKPIEKIKKGEKVLSFGGMGKNLIPCKVLDVWKTGEKETFEVQTRSGRILKCTGGHKFFAMTHQKGGNFGPNQKKGILGWTKLSNLKIGQKIAVARNLPIEKFKEDISLDTAKLLGWLVGDGNITDSFHSSITTSSLVEAKQVSLLAQKSFGLMCRITPYKKAKAFDVKLSSGIKIEKGGKRIANQLAAFLRKNSFHPVGEKKHIPKIILSQSNRIVAGFLSGLFHADGSVSLHRSSPVISYSTISKRLAEEVVFCLARLGIFATIHSRKGVGSFDNKYKSKKSHYIISLYGNDLLRFSKIVTFAGENKQQKLLKSMIGWKPQRLERKGNLFFEPIKKIVSLGKNETWDIEVEGGGKREGHSFVVEGILTHNSAGIGQESDLVFLIEREREKGDDAITYFTDVTKITLAKNRKTGQTVVGKFTMLKGRFVYDETRDKVEDDFKNWNDPEKGETIIEETKEEVEKKEPDITYPWW